MRFWPLFLLAAGALAVSACRPSSATAASGPLASASPIAVVVMENHSESGIIANPDAPYINSLASSYSYLDNYSAVAHPSLPNYLALIGGDTFGVTSDCTDCFISARNLADLLSDAGITGKAYMEDMPAPCFSGSSGRYAQKHNPFAYFNDIRSDPARCQSVVPYTQLATDMAQNQLPSFIWITPNLCDDMHDCDVATGDRWLAANIPPLLNSPAFAQSGLVALVWDENDGGAANRVPLILAGPRVKRGYVSHTPANHYSLLRTIEAAFGLPALTANDGNAQPIEDVFAT